MTAKTAVHLGFEIGTGKAVEIPIKHLAIVGQTQESGKTTTAEALISRSGLRAIAFVTKRAESAFRDGRRIPAYFRERADWQFVAAVLEATFRERMRFERAWIMRASKGAKTLADVQHNVRHAMKTAKGLSADVYLTLDNYLDIVIPQIEKIRTMVQRELMIGPGLNIMDLARYTMEMQALIIRSVLEWVYERERETITIIPEAWEFLPQQRGSPVLLAAEQLIRKGAAAQNYVWLDSQDIAGVHKNVLRSVIVWLIGVQREANEVKRALAHIPTSTPKPTTAEVMALGRGQFIACWGGKVVRVYVQPAWMSTDDARAVSLGGKHVVPEFIPASPPAWMGADEEDDDMDRQERELYEKQIADLKQGLEKSEKAVYSAGVEQGRLLKKLEAFKDTEHAIAALRRLLGSPPVASGNGPVGLDRAGIEALVQEVLKRIPAQGGAVYQVAPVEKLRKDYQQREVARMLEAVRAFSVTSKDVLALLEMTDGFLSQEKIALRLGKGMGGWLAQHLKPMREAGFIEIVERQGARGRLHEKIAEDLAHYQASEGEVEATYQQVMAAIAGASQDPVPA